MAWCTKADVVYGSQPLDTLEDFLSELVFVIQTTSTVSASLVFLGLMSWGKCPDWQTDHLKTPRYSNNMKTTAVLLWVLYSKSGVHIILATHLYSHLQSQGFKKVPSGRPSCYSLKNTLPQLPAPHLALPFQQVEAELRAGATWTLPAARPGTGWLTLLGGRGWPVTANLA